MIILQERITTTTDGVAQGVSMNDKYLPPVMEGIPADLTERSQRWCNWVTHLKPSGGTDERCGKFPVSPHTRKLIGVNRPEEWTNFADAKACYEGSPSEIAGVGCLFTAEDGLAGIDLDDAVEHGVLKEWAATIVERFQTYWELSPSGSGLKAWIKGTLPGRVRHRYSVGDGAVELYDQGRWFAVTGRRWQNCPATIVNCQADLEWLINHLSHVSEPTDNRVVSMPARGPKVGEGHRNTHLAKRAGQLVGLSLPDSALEAALIETNAKECEPPLPEPEVRSIAHSIAKYGFGHSWPELRPLPRPNEPIQMPGDIVPGVLGEIVNEVSAWAETPIELAALIGTAVIAATIANQVFVSAEPDYIEPTNIYVCPALESGNRKTAVLNALTDPLYALEKTLYEEYAPQARRIQSERKTRLAQIEKLRKSAEPGDAEAFVQILHMESEVPEEPISPQIILQDTTPEALGKMMDDHNGRVALFSDEGGIFDIFAGRYDKQPNLDIWLQGHAGSPIRSLLIEKPALTIAVSPQPGVLAALRNSPMFRSRGLLARFLYALPPSAVGHRKLVPSRLDAAVRSAFRELIFRLWHLEQSITLPLTDAAYAEWKQFQHDIERRMGDGEPLAGLRDWGSKLPGAALRVAAIFQATTSVQAITPQIMTAALAFAEILESHALAVFGLIASDPSIERADKVLRWLINRGVPVVDGRDVFNALQSSMKNMETFREAIQLLEDYGYVRATSRHGARGRHAMELEVNPKIWQVCDAGNVA